MRQRDSVTSTSASRRRRAIGVARGIRICPRAGLIAVANITKCLYASVTQFFRLECSRHIGLGSWTRVLHCAPPQNGSHL